MKIITEDFTKKPFKVDSLTKITLELEVGDVFVNKKNEIIMLRSIVGNEFTLMDGTGKIFTDANFLNEDWKSNHRFCGRYDHDFFSCWEDAVSLINENEK